MASRNNHPQRSLTTQRSKQAPPPSEIVDVVETGQIPTTSQGRGFGPVSVPRISRLRAQPGQEYVSGRPWYGGGWGNYGQPLGWAIDDVTRDFGDDTYERMMYDPQVYSSVWTLILSIVSNGLHLVPAVKKGEPDFDRAVELTGFCHRQLDGFPFLLRLVQLLHCLILGNRVAEIIFTVPDVGPDAGRLTLKDLKPKPRESIAFVVDSYMNLIGLLGRIPGQGLFLQAAGIITDPEKIPNLLPASKFFMLVHQPRDCDPRGTSLGRAAYASWNDKQQAMAKYQRFLAVLAGLIMVGICPEGAHAQQALDHVGNLMFDAAGNPVLLRPEDVLLASMTQLQDSTAAAFAFGTVITVLETQGQGDAYERAVQIYNDEISRAITGQTLATGEGAHMARASSETHKDTGIGPRVAYGRSMVETAVFDQLLKPLIRWNFGEEAVELTPRMSLSETEPSDFAVNAGAIASLMTAGYLVPEQMQETDAFLGLDVRPDNWQEMEEERAKKAAAPAPPSPALPPGDNAGKPGGEEED